MQELLLEPYKYIFGYCKVSLSVPCIILEYLILPITHRQSKISHSMQRVKVNALFPSGSVLYWCVIQIAVLWMCHVCIIFWTVKYPVHYMRCTANHQMKYIHASVAVVAIIIPTIVVAVAFATGGFVNNRFPPVLCLSRNADAGFFSLVLPISIITPSGVSLLLIVFWTLHKVNYPYTSTPLCA